MSRRDSVINALLGTFLLVVFFARYAAIGLVLVFALVGLDTVFHGVFRAGIPFDLTLGVFWTLLFAWRGIGQARKHLWKNAFLFLTAAPVIGFGWMLARSVDDHGVGLLYCFLPMIMVAGIAHDTNMGRLKFLLAAAVVGAVVSVNSGLLGYSALSRSVARGVLAVTLLSCFSGVWTAWTENRPTAPNRPLAPPAARA
jgi:hypothetical protein